MEKTGLKPTDKDSGVGSNADTGKTAQETGHTGCPCTKNIPPEQMNGKLAALSDHELVELALRKNQGAFASLLGRYREALLNHIMNYVNILEDAEDICQRSFEKAFMNIDTYNSRYAFSTWLYSIAQNEAIDHLRKNRNSISSVSVMMDREALDIGDNGSSPEEKVIVDQAVAELISTIQSLPESYSKVAELRFIRDYAYEDIATILGMPLGTVKTRINRARKMLIQLVQKAEDKNNSY